MPGPRALLKTEVNMQRLNLQTEAFRPDDMSDAALVKRAIRGDGAAFEAIMRRHNQLMFRTARAIMRNDTDAEDVIQESYLRAWRSLATFRSESKLSTWLVRITVNEALGRLRRTSAQVIPLEATMISPKPEIAAALTDEPERGPEQALQRSQIRSLMEARIDKLPEAYRAVFMLRAVEDMSVKEVAQALDLPEATVRTRFFRARSLLRESLAQDMDLALGEVFGFNGARCDRIVAGVLAKGLAEGLASKA